MISLYNDHAKQRGDLELIGKDTTLSDAQISAKLKQIEKESEDWTDLPRRKLSEAGTPEPSEFFVSFNCNATFSAEDGYGNGEAPEVAVVEDMLEDDVIALRKIVTKVGAKISNPDVEYQDQDGDELYYILTYRLEATPEQMEEIHALGDAEDLWAVIDSEGNALGDELFNKGVPVISKHLNEGEWESRPPATIRSFDIEIYDTREDTIGVAIGVVKGVKADSVAQACEKIAKKRGYTWLGADIGSLADGTTCWVFDPNYYGDACWVFDPNYYGWVFDPNYYGDGKLLPLPEELTNFDPKVGVRGEECRGLYQMFEYEGVDEDWEED